MINKKYFSSFGFTLIELLVVIAILGVLAGGVLVAINPLEQLARARDAGRKTTVDQLGKAVQSYFTAQSGVYPPIGTDWMTTIQTAGELKTLPKNPAGGASYSTGCVRSSSFEQTGYGYCYNQNGTDAIVYTRAESQSSKTAANCGSKVAWIVWSSADGKTGLDCEDAGTDPTYGVTGLK